MSFTLRLKRAPFSDLEAALRFPSSGRSADTYSYNQNDRRRISRSPGRSAPGGDNLLVS